jgi:hypothetical protein
MHGGEDLRTRKKEVTRATIAPIVSFFFFDPLASLSTSDPASEMSPSWGGPEFSASSSESRWWLGRVGVVEILGVVGRELDSKSCG